MGNQPRLIHVTEPSSKLTSRKPAMDDYYTIPSGDDYWLDTDAVLVKDDEEADMLGF